MPVCQRPLLCGTVRFGRRALLGISRRRAGAVAHIRLELRQQAAKQPELIAKVAVVAHVDVRVLLEHLAQPCARPLDGERAEAVRLAEWEPTEHELLRALDVEREVVNLKWCARLLQEFKEALTPAERVLHSTSPWRTGRDRRSRLAWDDDPREAALIVPHLPGWQRRSDGSAAGKGVCAAGKGEMRSAATVNAHNTSKSTAAPLCSATMACSTTHDRCARSLATKAALPSMHMPRHPKSRSRARVLEKCTGSFAARSTK
mmetsp:Transcript_1756/g.5250  ORF Transcript_1756/g.5250 Transcript_1756/m.5250 type:complete len:260 (+) Transcript_1756:1385-2164(+)